VLVGVGDGGADDVLFSGVRVVVTVSIAAGASPFTIARTALDVVAERRLVQPFQRLLKPNADPPDTTFYV
jgi:hypothetical protein